MSSDVSEAPPPCPDDCEGARINTLKQVRQEIAKACRLIKAGKLDAQRGGVLMNGYALMLKALIDQRDSRWMPRVKELWRDRETAKQPAAH
jgi:hypothetical protein